DRLRAHRVVDLVRAELRRLEQAGQTAERGARRAEDADAAAEVLHRRLGRVAGEAARGEELLHPRVRGDDRRARIGIRIEVVERAVEQRLELALEEELVDELAAGAAHRAKAEVAEEDEAGGRRERDRQDLELRRVLRGGEMAALRLHVARRTGVNRRRRDLAR